MGRYDLMTSDFNYQKETKCLSGELSSGLGKKLYGRIPENLLIKSHHTGKIIEFHLYKTDRDGSGEDIYGWNYKNSENSVTLLIIND